MVPGLGPCLLQSTIHFTSEQRQGPISGSSDGLCVEEKQVLI